MWIRFHTASSLTLSCLHTRQQKRVQPVTRSWTFAFIRVQPTQRRCQVCCQPRRCAVVNTFIYFVINSDWQVVACLFCGILFKVYYTSCTLSRFAVDTRNSVSCLVRILFRQACKTEIYKMSVWAGLFLTELQTASATIGSSHWHCSGSHRDRQHGRLQRGGRWWLHLLQQVIVT
jgi:hypothetical protein